MSHINLEVFSCTAYHKTPVSKLTIDIHGVKSDDDNQSSSPYVM